MLRHEKVITVISKISGTISISSESYKVVLYIFLQFNGNIIIYYLLKMQHKMQFWIFIG